MALTLEEADAMIEAAKKAGVKMMIGQTRHFDHRYVNIKEQLDAGKVGRPVFIRRAERQFLPFPPDAWQWDPKRGGGVILDIGVHATDLFRWFLGHEAVEVYAIAKSVREAAKAAGFYDHAFITCKFDGGGIGFAEAGWAYPQGFGRALSRSQRHAQPAKRAIGAGGHPSREYRNIVCTGRGRATGHGARRRTLGFPQPDNHAVGA